MAFINRKAKELSKELHLEEHKIIEGKLPSKDHKLYDWYYLMASGIYQNLSDKLDLVIQENIKLKKRITTNSVELRNLTKKLRQVISDKEVGK